MLYASYSGYLDFYNSIGSFSLPVSPVLTGIIFWERSKGCLDPLKKIYFFLNKKFYVLIFPTLSSFKTTFLLVSNEITYLLLAILLKEKLILTLKITLQVLIISLMHAKM